MRGLNSGKRIEWIKRDTKYGTDPSERLTWIPQEDTKPLTVANQVNPGGLTLGSWVHQGRLNTKPNFHPNKDLLQVLTCGGAIPRTGAC